MAIPHFKIPLNLPHAAQVAVRVRYHLHGMCVAEELTARLVDGLDPFRHEDSNPPAEVALKVVEDSAAIARQIVDEIERLKAGHDRVGQAIRNLFECLGLGEEGAEISLRAGENPNSLLRPV